MRRGQKRQSRGGKEVESGREEQEEEEEREP